MPEFLGLYGSRGNPQPSHISFERMAELFGLDYLANHMVLSEWERASKDVEAESLKAIAALEARLKRGI